MMVRLLLDRGAQIDAKTKVYNSFSHIIYLVIYCTICWKKLIYLVLSVS